MTTIITKNGTGVPSDSSLSTGELAVDTTNGKLYTSSNGTNIVNVGSSTGIDDNATSTAVTISSSQKVGIGTDDPQQLLEVSASLNPVIRLDSSLVGNENAFDDKFMGGVEWYTNDTSGIGEHIGASLRAFSNASVATVTPGYELIFSTSLADVAESEAMRIDGNGNVGIGLNNPSYPLDINVADGTEPLRIDTNTSTSVDAITFLGAQDQEATIKFHREGSTRSGIGLATSVAGVTTEALRVDSDGNVGIGTSDPSRTLEVVSPSANTSIFGSAASTTNTKALIYSDSATTAFGNVGASNDLGSESLRFVSGTQRLYTGNTERMRIDSSGNVGIGTSSPKNSANYKTLTISGVAGGQLELRGGTGTYDAFAYVDTLGLTSIVETGGAHRFYTGGSESMRLDTNGNLLVGKSTPAVTTVGHSIEPDGRINLTAAGSASETQIAFYRNGNASTSGTIQTTSTTTNYVTTSDVRLKENIVDAPAGNIDSIKVRSFDWKVDGSHQEYGFVAQELNEVAPYAVSKGETEDDTWGVDYSKLVPMLVKEIQDLKAEVAALKGA